MTFFQGILLGLIQGITEFLPVSSSGHLALARAFLGIKVETPIAFDVSIHVATLAVVVIYFRLEVLRFLRGLWFLALSLVGRFHFEPDSRQAAEGRLALFVVIASVPTAIIAFLLKDWVEGPTFQHPFPVGIMLVWTGLLLWMMRGRTGDRRIDRMRLGDALLIGIVQGLAVFPGLSRSGSTISVGVMRGIERRFAARFSFLLFIPAISGAAVIELPKLLKAEASIGAAPIVAGTVAAFIAGLIALAWLIHLVERRRLSWFAPYCWVVGAIAIIYGLL